MIRWTPRFLWTDDDGAHDETLELPVGLWRHSFPVVGGDIESDAGVPASYVVRREYCLAVPVRYLEEEWPIIRALIAHGQNEGQILWIPDAEIPGTSYNVYLESPAIGDDVRPVIDAEFPAALSVILTFRKVNGATFDTSQYFEEAA